MKFSVGDRLVVFAPDVVKIMQGYRQTARGQHEAGGILLGRIYSDSVAVERVSEPSGEDQSGRYFFNRSRAKAQKVVNNAWKSSKGELVYVGEWHTHPERNPTPSPTDRELIAGMIRDSKMEIDHLFLAIVGIDNWYVACQSKQTLERMQAIV